MIAIFGCSDWVSAHRVSYMNENSVAPGQTATFDFWMCNEHGERWQNGGSWTEHFAVARGGHWLSDGYGDVPKFEASIELWPDWLADRPSPSTLAVDIDADGQSPAYTISIDNDGFKTMAQLWE